MVNTGRWNALRIKRALELYNSGTSGRKTAQIMTSETGVEFTRAMIIAMSHRVQGRLPEARATVNRPRSWTPEQDDALRALWSGPDSIAVISQALDRTRDSITKRARSLGLPHKVTTGAALLRSTDWPPVLAERLRDLWINGASAAEIAKLLSTRGHPVTRCAVIGKVARMKLQRSKDATKETMRLSKGDGARPKKLRPVIPLYASEPLTIPTVASPDLPTLALLGRGCKWPIGDVRRGDGDEQRFCGCSRPLKRPYCAEHTVVSAKGWPGGEKRWERGVMRAAG